jgi:hypothetical protein
MLLRSEVNSYYWRDTASIAIAIPKAIPTAAAYPKRQDSRAGVQVPMEKSETAAHASTR